MGFNKRIIDRERIIETPVDKIEMIFNADALLMDKWSGRFLQLYLKGYDKENIVKLLDNEFTKS